MGWTCEKATWQIRAERGYWKVRNGDDYCLSVITYTLAVFGANGYR